MQKEKQMENYTLIICEKKDVATKLKDYFERNGNSYTPMKGYYMSDTKNKYEITCITWLAGHILTDYEPEEYDPSWKNWSTGPLPMIPEEFKKKPDPDKGKKFQYDVVMSLIPNAAAIINAGDPDREGQVLVDELLQDQIGKKDIRRMILSGLNDEMIERALKSMKPDSDYRGLYLSGVARSHIDWLLGMNLTRHFTRLWHKGGMTGTVPIGRVKTPTVALVVKREEAIRGFKQENWYTVNAQIVVGGMKAVITLDSKEKITDKNKADAIKNAVLGKSFIVKNVESDQKTQGVKELYQLNTLQVDADKYCDIPVSETLKAAESLYLGGYTSYPRTECRYLPESQRKDAPAIAKAINEKISSEIGIIPTGDNITTNVGNSPVFNDKKLGAHHALVPTGKIPDLSKLSETEKQVYLLIVRKYASIFFPPYMAEQIKVRGTIDSYDFTLSYTKPSEIGWKVMYLSYGKTKKKNKEEDNDKQEMAWKPTTGSTYSVIGSQTVKKTTRPPKPYTDATLIAAMAGIQSEDESLNTVLKQVKGIGTSATQATIIDQLIKNKLLYKVKKEIHPTDLAMQVTDILPKILTEADYTGQMELALAKLENGEVQSEKPYLDNAVQLINAILKQCTAPLYSREYPCPACGKGYIIYHEYVSKDTGEVHQYARCNNEECRTYWPVENGKPKLIRCPKCGKGWMKEKKNMKTGNVFYGCSEYPECRGTMTEEDFKKAKEEKP